MSTAMITVQLSGPPGLDFRIIPRDRGDEPPPPVIEAALTPEGRAVVRIPAGYYVVTAPRSETKLIQARPDVSAYSITLP